MEEGFGLLNPAGLPSRLLGFMLVGVDTKPILLSFPWIVARNLNYQAGKPVGFLKPET